MKVQVQVRLLVAAILILVCSGCVPYYYNDPYYHPYGYGPRYPYSPPAVYVNPGLFYVPLPYIDYGYRGHRPYRGGRY